MCIESHQQQYNQLQQQRNCPALQRSPQEWPSQQWLPSQPSLKWGPLGASTCAQYKPGLNFSYRPVKLELNNITSCLRKMDHFFLTIRSLLYPLALREISWIHLDTTITVFYTIKQAFEAASRALAVSNEKIWGVVLSAEQLQQVQYMIGWSRWWHKLVPHCLTQKWCSQKRWVGLLRECLSCMGKCIENVFSNCVRPHILVSKPFSV